MMTESHASALQPTRFIDSTSDVVRDFVHDHAGTGNGRERVIRLYYAIRDGIRYDPYHFNLEPQRFVASDCLSSPAAFCVPKAIALAATARAIGIASRLGFANVRNHLTSNRLTELMGSDIFRWHGYTSLLIDGNWVKATPAFNLALCEKFGIKPLEFDGREDSIFHAFDSAGRQHMEYVEQVGEFDDMPFDAFATDMRAHYPRLLAALGDGRPARQPRFEDEVDG